MNYHIVYNNFKDYAELFIKNIDFSKANINKVLFLHIGDEEAISEIIENTNFKNAEFYIKDEDSIYDIIETLYNEKVHKFLEYNNMEFDLIIANPPYGSLGNPIISEAIEHLTDNGTASVLMPLSCYKKNELYRHVETFELANPKLFKDAEIQKNLAIATLNAKKVDKYEMYDLYISSYDRRYILFYEWNISNSKSFTWKNASYTPAKDFDLDKDFIDITRCYSSGHGRTPGFGKKGFGYKFNMLRNIDWSSADIGVLHFESKRAKDNFCKYAYNWSTQVGDCLCSKVMAGLHLDHATGTCLPSIPQIDWASISDKYPNYEKDPDYYVLKEMGLKWDDKKEKIIKE